MKVERRNACQKAGVRAEVELYPDAKHGWCVPDSTAAANRRAVDRAGKKTIGLLETAI